MSNGYYIQADNALSEAKRPGGESIVVAENVLG